MAIMRARTKRPARRKRGSGTASEEAHRRRREGGPACHDAETNVSCVRANADPEGRTMGAGSAASDWLKYVDRMWRSDYVGAAAFKLSFRVCTLRDTGMWTDLMSESYCFISAHYVDEMLTIHLFLPSIITRMNLTYMYNMFCLISTECKSLS